MIVTIAERKARAIERLKTAAAEVEMALAAYAKAHGGHFVIFGSFARDDVRPDSDLDVMVDFPAGMERAARDVAETICRERGIDPDVHLKAEVSNALMTRIVRDGIALP